MESNWVPGLCFEVHGTDSPSQNTTVARTQKYRMMPFSWWFTAQNILQDVETYRKSSSPGISLI